MDETIERPQSAPRATCSTSGVGAAAPPSHRGRLREHETDAKMVSAEASAELEAIRAGGPEASVRRINHLKATAMAHERQIELLTASLVAQHELCADPTRDDCPVPPDSRRAWARARRLHDVSTRVAQLAQTVKRSQEQVPGGSLSPTESNVLQLHQRLQRGLRAVPSVLRSGGMQ